MSSRKFNGQKFQFLARRNTKKEANEVRQKLKKRNPKAKARVVKSKRGKFEVFFRTRK